MSSSSKVTNVKVCCRFRPVNEQEERLDRGKGQVIEFEGPQGNRPGDWSQCGVNIHSSKKQVFSFDNTFDDNVSQEMVFDKVAAPMVDAIFDGYNTTIFAYGQTGSGKTYTMMGNPYNKEEQGIIPRMVNAIFDRIDQADLDQQFTVKLAYIEIYNEKIKDLLNPMGDLPLEIEGGMTGVRIKNVKENYVGDVNGVFDIMNEGIQNRAVASTNVNEASSRSHAVFILTLTQESNRIIQKKSAKLCLIDLAGSEKIRKTGASGQTMTEARYINKSLSALGKVINLLSKPSSERQHIPYRDSKLTRLLSDALGGNSKTCLVVTCSPSSYNVEETVSTLRFGSSAKHIKNKIFQNVERSPAEYRQLLKSLNGRIEKQNKIIRLFEADIAALCGVADPNQTMPTLYGATEFKKYLALGSALPDASEFGDDASDTDPSETGSGRRSFSRSPRNFRSESKIDFNTPDKSQSTDSGKRTKASSGTHTPSRPDTLTVPLAVPLSIDMLRQVSTTPGKQLDSKTPQEQFSTHEQLIIINESEGEETLSEDEDRKALEKRTGVVATRPRQALSDESQRLKERVRELEDSLSHSQKEQHLSNERIARSNERLNEEAQHLSTLRNQHNEELAAEKEKTRLSNLQLESLQNQLEEFTLLRKRVELTESNNALAYQSLQKENQELQARIAELLAGESEAKETTTSGASRKDGHFRTSSFGEGSEAYQRKVEDNQRLAQHSAQLEDQLKVMDSKLNKAHTIAHDAQQKNMARIAKLERQLAQASVMCEKLLQSSMYWRDRRQAMTRAKIMIPIQGGGGHGRPREAPASSASAAPPASTSSGPALT